MPEKLDTDVLLHKGMELLSERGIAGISIQDIVKATGAHRGSLYRHFESREGFIRAVLEYYRTYSERTLLVPMRATPGVAGILSYLDNIGIHLKTPLGRQGCLAATSSTFSPLDEDIAQALVKHSQMYEDGYFDALIEEQKAGTLAPGIDPRAQAGLLVACIQGLFVLVRNHPDPEPIERTLKAAKVWVQSWTTAQQ